MNEFEVHTDYPHAPNGRSVYGARGETSAIVRLGSRAKVRAVAWLLCAGASVPACGTPDPRVAELEKRVTALEMSQAAADQAGFASEIELLKARADSTDQILGQFPSTSASFATDQKGFQPISTNFGVFLVALDDVKAYANGYKVTFELGNPQAVNFQGADIEVRWGPKRPDDFKTLKYGDWLKQFRTSKQSTTRILKAGFWNPVEVVLAPAEAGDIGIIEITSISTKSVSLSR